ncbi:HD domain-containing protein [Alkaliphilus transvaalensis]|uniref:HD domain-containing protein n=1 Tax=Alkaliphilus transvaalensis TaxID=114628 RepID=UPI0004788F60|nr:HD domain-containing protein [Alkaliphilus transvaalensis]
MDLIKIKEIATKQLANRKERSNRERGYTYRHGERVASLAILLRKMISNDGSNDDIIRVASWFHDISKGVEPHGKYGAIVAREILNEYCSQSDLDRICEIIKNHQIRLKENIYPEYIKIVQDADILDHFGNIGIWITFFDHACVDKSVDEVIGHYGEDFVVHVAKMRELLNYDISKEIFDDKINNTLAFISDLSVEVSGGICSKQMKHK